MEGITFRVELLVSAEGKAKAVMLLWIVGSQLEDQRCSAMRSTETVARRIGRDVQKDLWHDCRDTSQTGVTQRSETRKIV